MKGGSGVPSAPNHAEARGEGGGGRREGGDRAQWPAAGSPVCPRSRTVWPASRSCLSRAMRGTNDRHAACYRIEPESVPL
eukprot:11552912-Heterocapsa_arctica.AAC.1